MPIRKSEQYLRLAGSLARIALGAFFVFTGALKILTPLEEFQALIREYHFLPLWIVPAFAIALPILEVVIGLALMLGLFESFSALGIAVLLAMFIIAVTSALARGISLENCGCFGSFKFGDGPQELMFRDWLLLLLALTLALRPPKRLALDNIL